jgi:ubiquitin-like modifier-activating enzyme 5
MLKTDAAKQTLSLINPDVVIIPYNYNITTVENYDRFITTLRTEGTVIHNDGFIYYM